MESRSRGLGVTDELKIPTKSSTSRLMKRQNNRNQGSDSDSNSMRAFKIYHPVKKQTNAEEEELASDQKSSMSHLLAASVTP